MLQRNAPEPAISARQHPEIPRFSLACILRRELYDRANGGPVLKSHPTDTLDNGVHFRLQTAGRKWAPFLFLGL